MRAVVLTGHGGPEVLQVQEKPDPPVGPGEVRIAVKAAGINFADTMARVGLYPEAPKPPCVARLRGRGRHRVGRRGRRPTTRWETGSWPGPASAARRRWSRCRRTRRCRCPTAFSYEQGAAFPVNYATSYVALVMMGGPPRGRAGADSRRGGRRRDLRDPDRPLARGRDLRHRIRPPSTTRSARRASSTRSTTAPRTSSRRSGGSPAARGSTWSWTRPGPTNFRKDYRLLREGGRLIMYGALRARRQPGRSIPKLSRSLIRMPFATMPWWKSLQ